MTERKRLDPTDRRQLILNAAVSLAKKDHFEWLTRSAVAAAAGVSPGLVSNYFAPFVELKREVLREAVRTENLVILAQGMGAGHPIVKRAPAPLRAKIAQHLTRS